MDVGQFEVVQPASYQPVEPPDSFGETYGDRLSGQLLQFKLEGLPAHSTYHQLVLTFGPLFEYRDKMIAQYVECGGASPLPIRDFHTRNKWLTYRKPKAPMPGKHNGFKRLNTVCDPTFEFFAQPLKPKTVIFQLYPIYFLVTHRLKEDIPINI